MGELDQEAAVPALSLDRETTQGGRGPPFLAFAGAQLPLLSQLEIAGVPVSALGALPSCSASPAPSPLAPEERERLHRHLAVRLPPYPAVGRRIGGPDPGTIVT